MCDSTGDLICTSCDKQRYMEDKCFKKAQDLKLCAKKSAQNTSSGKSKAASAYVACTSEVTLDNELAEEEF